ncbi:MAG: hypothetical protein WCB16_16955, partial [Candidatus Binatus sp.]
MSLRAHRARAQTRGCYLFTTDACASLVRNPRGCQTPACVESQPAGTLKNEQLLFMKKILILGVNGFIGHHLTKRIIETT